MKKPTYYWIGFVVSVFLSVRYFILNGVDLKSFLVVAIIQIVFQVFMAIVKKVKKEEW